MLTRRCPLNCGYCYVKKENKDMTEKILDKSIDFGLKKANETNADYFHLSLTGGEPFLKPKLIRRAITKLNEELDKRKIVFQPTITTNGTIFNKKLLLFLKKNKENLLEISIDGYKEIHDKNRRYIDGRGSYFIVEENARKMLKILPWARSTTTISKEFLNIENFEKVFNNIFGIGFRHIRLGLLQRTYTDDQIKAFYIGERLIIKNAIKKIINGEYLALYPISKNLLHKEIYNNEDKNLIDSSKFSCGAGKRHFTIDVNGDIYPCTIYLEYCKQKSFLGNLFDKEIRAFKQKKCIAERIFPPTTNIGLRLSKENYDYFVKLLRKESCYDKYLDWLKKWVR